QDILWGTLPLGTVIFALALLILFPERKRIAETIDFPATAAEPVVLRRHSNGSPVLRHHDRRHWSAGRHRHGSDKRKRKHELTCGHSAGLLRSRESGRLSRRLCAHRSVE